MATMSPTQRWNREATNKLKEIFLELLFMCGGDGGVYNFGDFQILRKAILVSFVNVQYLYRA